MSEFCVLCEHFLVLNFSADRLLFLLNAKLRETQTEAGAVRSKLSREKLETRTRSSWSQRKDARWVGDRTTNFPLKAIHMCLLKAMFLWDLCVCVPAYTRPLAAHTVVRNIEELRKTAKRTQKSISGTKHSPNLRFTKKNSFFAVFV